MNHGLLHAPQVNYIIRSDVKIINHRRTLVLYVYDRQKAAAGSAAPVWTMFQASEEYTTLARQEDGTASWREAAFENLDRDYYFTMKCAFYSAQDEQRVCRYFHDDRHSGMAALLRAQDAILEKRAQERQLKREKRTIARMRTLRALPRGLNAWVRREVMPAYFRCQHSSAKKPVTGVCTSCGKESTLPHAAHNAKVVCPRCKRELTVKSAGKMRRHFDRDTAQIIEKISDNEIVIRIIKAFQGYAGLKDRQRLLRWQLDSHVSRDVAQVLEHMTAHKLMKYMDAQYAMLRLRSGHRYNTLQYAVSEYRDYLDMCARLEYDMSNDFVLYPKDLQEAHDRVQNLVKANADALLRRDFQRAMEAVAGHLDFELDGMRILLPASPKELADEGHALHHCVGRYADRIAQKECIILFLRKCEDISKPFYTVEIRNRKIVQVRGMGNRDATPEVEKFMAKWERQVLQAA